MTRLFFALLTLFFLNGPAIGENSDFRRCTLAAKSAFPVGYEGGPGAMWIGETPVAESRINFGPEHGIGNVEHNNAIEDLLEEAQSQGATDLRKNRVQRDVAGNRVYDGNGGYTRPDASYIQDGMRYNFNRVSNLDDLERELKAFHNINLADPNAVNSLEF